MLRSVLVCIGLCLLAAPSSARLISWEAASGVLPWDVTIPEADRFTASGQLDFAELTPTALHIHDSTFPERIVVERSEPMGPAWALQIDARVFWAIRNPPAFALQSGVSDGERYVPLGVTPTEVGFINSGGNGWIDGQFFELDTTDAVHRYDMQRVDGVVRLFIDGSATPALSLPVESFAATASESVLLLATSIAGTAEFEIERFHVETGISETAVPDQIADHRLLIAPNPFNAATTIRFGLEAASAVEIDVHDAKGRLVRHLLDRQLGAGEHRVTWDGRDDRGQVMASGSYWVLLRSATGRGVERLVLAK